MSPFYSTRLIPQVTPQSAPWRLSEALLKGLLLELDLTPKPGLVDRRDSGSHQDLNYPLMRRSITQLADYFTACARALHTGGTIETLRDLGIQAERHMFATLGTNTHRGAIFLGGVMMAAVHHAQSTDEQAVSDAIAAVAEQLFSHRLPRRTKGAQARQRYHAGGIIQETLAGLPSVFSVAVPALRQAQQLGLTQRDSHLLALARLMQIVEDTTALRRCGPAGLAQLKRDGTILETLLLNQVDPVLFLVAANQHYQTQRLTMGGVADLLAISTSWLLFTPQDMAPEPRLRPSVQPAALL